MGWCEQIASSLVVLARSQGIPARLATGYVMSERDPVSGTYVVRAKDAHAWAEVWFPEVGWVPFDPTADVPLAADSTADDTFADWLVEHLVQVLVAVAVLVAAAIAGRRLLRRVRRRRRDRPRSWAQLADRRLTAVGEAAGVPRRPGDTAVGYARRLGEVGGEAGGTGLPDLVPVGEVVDGHQYAPVAPSPAQRAAADDLLDAAEAVPADSARRSDDHGM